MIPPEVEPLLEALERFERIRRRVARLGERLCDLSYANPYEGAVAAARSTLRGALEHERSLDLQYAPFGGHTLARRACADSLRRSHGLPFSAGDVVLTPGAMTALQLALRVAGCSGGEVVIPTPCWLDHPLYARALGLEPRLVELPEPAFRLDAEAVASALSPRTCAVVLTHPGNPTGVSHTPAELEALGAALRDAEERYGCRPTLVADEVHRDFLEGEYASAAGSFDRTLIVYSFGKYHFMQGQRLGYAAVSPSHPQRDEMASELVRWTRITGVATPTALMQRALPRLLELRHDHSWLGPLRRRMIDNLVAAGYEVTPPDGTLFLYARTPGGYEHDFAFAEALAAGGVLVLPAPVFHHEGFFRLALTASEEMIDRALPVLEEAARA